MSKPDWSAATGSLDLDTLTEAYAAGTLTPTIVISAIYNRIASRGDDHVWIHLISREDALKAAAALEAEGYDGRPLWGIPFSVKDLTNTEGVATTQGSALFADNVPRADAVAVARARAAGARVGSDDPADHDQAAVSVDVGVRAADAVHPLAELSRADDDPAAAGGSRCTGCASGPKGWCRNAARDAPGTGVRP